MNCFFVLGIEPTKDKKRIKRAYAKLIKKYHPEDDKEGYMNIKTAYEEALKFVSSNSKDYVNKDFLENIRSESGNENRNFSFELEYEDKKYANKVNKPFIFNTHNENNNIDNSFDFRTIDTDNIEDTVNNLFKELCNVYTNIGARLEEKNWVNILSKSSYQMIFNIDDVRHLIIKFFECHIAMPQNVWKVIDYYLGITKEENRAFYSQFGYFYGYSFYFYVSKILELKECLSYVYIKNLDYVVFEKYVYLRNKFELDVNYNYNKQRVFSQFTKLKQLVPTDAELYYIMATVNLKFTFDDNLYYLDEANRNIKKAISLDKNNLKYIEFQNHSSQLYKSKMAQKQKQKTIKKAALFAAIFCIICLVFEYKFIFMQSDDLIAFRNCVTPFRGEDYDVEYFGGTCDKDKAIKTLKDANINSKEEAIDILDYFSKNKMSQKISEDFSKYSKDKISELEDINKDKEIGQRLILNEVCEKELTDDNISLMYKRFVIKMKLKKEIDSDFLQAYESLAGNYVAQTAYRAGYIDIEKANEYCTSFTNKYLNKYHDKDKKVVVTVGNNYGVNSSDLDSEEDPNLALLDAIARAKREQNCVNEKEPELKPEEESLKVGEIYFDNVLNKKISNVTLNKDFNIDFYNRDIPDYHLEELDIKDASLSNAKVSGFVCNRAIKSLVYLVTVSVSAAIFLFVILLSVIRSKKAISGER